MYFLLQQHFVLIKKWTTLWVGYLISRKCSNWWHFTHIKFYYTLKTKYLEKFPVNIDSLFLKYSSWMQYIFDWIHNFFSMFNVEYTIAFKISIKKSPPVEPQNLQKILFHSCWLKINYASFKIISPSQWSSWKTSGRTSTHGSISAPRNVGRKPST